MGITLETLSRYRKARVCHDSQRGKGDLVRSLEFNDGDALAFGPPRLQNHHGWQDQKADALKIGGSYFLVLFQPFRI